MGGEGYGEAALLGDVVGDDGGGHLVHLEAAVLFGDVDGGEAEVGGLLDEAAGDGEVLGLDLVGGGDDLVEGEVGGGLGDLAVLLGEVLGEEAVRGRGVGDEEAAAWNDGGSVRIFCLLYDFHVPIPSLPYFVQILQNIRLRSGP